MIDKELIVFIIIEIVGLIPLGLYFLVKINSEEGDLATRLFKNYMIRSLVVIGLCLPVFFLVPEKKLVIVIIDIALQFLNAVLLRMRK